MVLMSKISPTTFSLDKNQCLLFLTIGIINFIPSDQIYTDTVKIYNPFCEYLITFVQNYS